MTEIQAACNDDGQSFHPGGRILPWAAIITLSSAGGTISVHFASPFTLDEMGTTFILFFLLPAFLVILPGVLHRVAGIAAACAIPFVWVLCIWEKSDSLLIWLIPIFTMILIVQIARINIGSRLRMPISLIGLLFGLSTLLWPTPKNPTHGTRLLLVGVDGATWKRIDPLLSSGRLPCITNLLATGHRAILRSLQPTISPQIWSTIATGFPASTHGIKDFGNQQSDFLVGRIWDQLKAEGRSIGICSWLFTWPPIEGLGPHDFVIPSVFAPDDRCFPPEFGFFWNLAANEHPARRGNMSNFDCGMKAFRYGVRLSTLRRGVINLLERRLKHFTYLDQSWRSRQIYTAVQADICAELIRNRQPEFMAIYFSQLDPVSHFYWRFSEPEWFPEVSEAYRIRYQGVIDEIYVEIDRSIKKILDVSPREVDLLMVSDHGFQALKKRYGNQFCRIKTEALIRILGFTDRVLGTNVSDWVYLRPIVSDKSEREHIISRLGADLGSAHFVGETNPLFSLEYQEDAIHLQLAPRPALPPEPIVVFPIGNFPLHDVLLCKPKARISGTHHQDGVYLLAGPSAAKSIPADTLSVLDVTPTLAALLHLPAVRGWKGLSALQDSLIADSSVVQYPLPNASVVPTSGIDESLKEKMRAIGYLE